MKKFTKGFTLIELLIVIALLGALAVGLLAALDPFEQLKKGTDTGTRNKVAELHASIIRYYGIKSHMPWCPTGVGCPADPSGTDMVTAPMIAAIADIVAVGELKTEFITLAGGDTTKVFTTGSEVAATAKVCFRPSSKSFLSDANSKFDKFGVLGTACSTDADRADLAKCFWCVQ